MGCFSFRSLLLAAIVISNCITWTASRHSYLHNVSGRRHRRQDAGENQPNTYVIPGGEGSEKGWGPWTDPTPCSRTCGGGVASQKRKCLTLESGANCTGGDKKYFSCNTQDCPGASDFRAEQCAEFNKVALHSAHSSTTGFGCCDDGQTAAHGPNKLGCCLLTPHGCCPDNFQPAQGANQEGCDCKNSPFGCCPDQRSYATGANHTGCGCQHTTHGCCPNRHTEATGPNFEGCSCHTHQFGCCPDGVTPAIGFNLQGCRCEESKHGCCGDGVTPATGPNKEGCNCASSKYSCCPDGVTESQSKNFTGCAEALINKQAACALPYDQGNCTKYFIQWFYDMGYGGCSRFHYGGCGGNGNRFEDRAECESVCIQPAPRDQCHLPKVKGSCTNNITVRWYYNDNYQRCLQFDYGGCLGNKNRFYSQEDCEKQCSPKLDEEGQCQLPIEEGPCAGNYTRWGYNETTGRCEEFLWGGCQGNPNRFISEAACVLRCNPPGKKKPVCDQPQDAGTCTEMNPYWSYSKKEDRCVPFYYGGCGGNENKFSTQEQCEGACPKSYKCHRDELRCDHTRCVSVTKRCDGHNDCEDGVDEQNCTPIECHRDELRCDHTRCVSVTKRCDGHNDCEDGVDEQNCTPIECHRDELRCDHTRCVSVTKRCDGHNDCEDGVDEQNCTPIEL